MTNELAELSKIIYLAITPAVLLLGIGSQMRVLITRLRRITSRSRTLEDRLRTAEGGETLAMTELELTYQLKRMELIHIAITLCAFCALMTSVAIMALFISNALSLVLDTFIALSFILTMLSLIVSFVLFLREIFIAIQTLPLSLQQHLSAEHQGKQEK